MGDYADGINLDEIDDELELHNLLDNSDDIEERKMIRNRLREVMAAHRAEREEMIRKREEDRENILRKRVADSDEHKRRTLAMYDAMAKSAPAGGNKNIDVSILRTGIASAQPVVAHQKLDLVEEAIKDRQKSSDDQKKRTLIAFDKAARSAPAGMARIVDFDCVNKEDMCKTDKPPNYSSCFEMRGGVPSAAKVVVPKPMQYTGEPERDLMEEAIRKRQTEADDRKRRTLAAYDQAARSRPAGQPVSVYIPTTDGIDPVVTVLERPNRPNTPSGPTGPVWRPAGQQHSYFDGVNKPQSPVPQSPTPQQQSSSSPVPQMYKPQPVRPQPTTPQHQQYRPQQQQYQQKPMSPTPQQQYRPQQQQKPMSPTPPRPQQQMYQPPRPQQQQQQPPRPQQQQQQPLMYQPRPQPQQQPPQPQMYQPRGQPQPQMYQPRPQQQQQPQPQPQMYKPPPQQAQQPPFRPQMVRPEPLPPQQQGPINIKTQSVRKVSNPYENARNEENSVRTTTTTQKIIGQPQQIQSQRQVMVSSQQTRTVTQQQQQQRRYYDDDDDEDESEEEESD